MNNLQLQGIVDEIVVRLDALEKRLHSLERELQSQAGGLSRTCKVCNTSIDSANTSKKGLLAEVCDTCWQTLDSETDGAV